MLSRRLLRSPIKVRGLLVKFLLLVIPLFTFSCATGLFALTHFESRSIHNAFSARVGSMAGRVASAIERHVDGGIVAAAQDVLDTLLADLAIECGEIHMATGSGRVLETPRGLGCIGRESAPAFTVVFGENDQFRLTVRYSDAEVVAATRLRRELSLLVLLAGMLIACVACWLGFWRFVGRPLQLLLTAIDTAPEAGTREAVAISGNDEIAVVARAYNTLQARIADAHERLEERVAERSEAAMRAAEDATRVNNVLESEVERRKRIELDLRETNAALEAATQVKSEFLAKMSHEIRTPMNGVLGMLNLLAKSDLPARQSHLAATAKNSAEALLNVLNGVLDFSKLEANRMTLEAATFDLPKLMTEVVTLFQTAAQQKGITLSAELPPELPQMVNGDPTRLRQILINLVGNAIKFTNEGGVVITAARRGSNVGFSRIRFEVADTGVGIPQIALADLFSPFVQASASTARKFGGTGLGLAICRELVTLMGGRIGVDSREGHGSTFWLEIDLRNGEAPAVVDHAVAPNRRRGLSILVAEDNPVNQLVAEGLLTEAGHSIKIVSDGRKAVEAARQCLYDVILMDMQMPEMDGLQATRCVRKLPGAAGAVPIIALTANAGPEDRANCRQAGMDGFVPKPFQPDQLDREIARVVGVRRHARGESEFALSA